MNNLFDNTNKPLVLRASPGIWFFRFILGILVGVSAILPGISGGVLCVSFGIYRPLIALLSHPVQAFRTYYSLFIPFAIGWATGFLALARVVEALFNSLSTLVICLFVGLIVGTCPSLFDKVNKRTPTKGSWSFFTISLIIFFAFLSYLKSESTIEIEPNAWWYLLCGFIWGISIVIPGLSSSSILIFLGLYQDMVEHISDIRMSVMLPVLGGIIIAVLISARLVNFLLEKHHALIVEIILGIVISSTLMIIPTQFLSIWQIASSLLSFATGYAISLAMSRMEIKK
ncbi:MAG: DUF368 domain-containing protein [Clostridiales bacterium]|jgi:putative membrane protein|nr:DUF368 domain-containing protein [Clostridiales bacterium]